MQQILLFILLGLGSGALIAGLALGLVVTYRGSGIVNLATGATAMLAGYAFWALRTNELGIQLGTVPALIVALLFVMGVGAASELLVYRPLRTSSPLAKLVASLGVLLVAQASMLLAFGTSSQPEPGVLPESAVKVLGAVVPVDRFILTGIVIVIAIALVAAYQWSRFGLATRAASENEVAAMLGGLSPNALSMANTLIASLVAGGIGILAASITQLDTETLPLQIVPALAAALLARFTSFWIACAAGIGLGILDSLIQYLTNLSWFPQAAGVALPGVQELVIFIIIVIVMFLRGADLPSRGELVERRLPAVPRPGKVVEISGVALVVLAIAMIVLPYDFREALINTMIGTLMALSFVVITGFVGQISVVQLTLSGVTGFTVSHLAVNAGIGFPIAPIIGVAAAVLLGLVTAVSALRVRGVNLAVVTLAAVVAITNFGFTNPTWGGGQTGSPVPSPHLFSLNLGPSAGLKGLDGNPPSAIFGWLVLACTIALCLLVAWMRRGNIGRRMLAVRSNERAAAAAAINPRNVKLVAFGASSMIVGVAGALTAYNAGSISTFSFDPIAGLSLIAFAYAGGIGLISGAAFAGLISTQALFPYALDKWFGLNGNWFLLFGGVVLILTLIQNPEGVAGAFYRKIHARSPVAPPEEAAASASAAAITASAVGTGTGAAVETGGAAEPLAVPEPSAPSASAPAAAASTRRARSRSGVTDDRPTVLRARGLSVSFGGVHAVNHVDLEVREGELVGLIGPNGAGKTTFIDAITGFVRSTGSIELDGRDIGRMPPHERARLGLARTWQGTDLFDDLDVSENLTVAGWTGDHAARARHVVTDPLAFVGLEWAAAAMPSELPQGQRKLVGVARALAGQPRLLCLDEPAAGLDSVESEQLGQRLRDLADRGQSTLLIDHDMGIVLGICDRVVVLEFGRVIAEGPPDVVRDDPQVVAAYLGGGSDSAQSQASEEATGGVLTAPAVVAEEPDALAED